MHFKILKRLLFVLIISTLAGCSSGKKSEDSSRPLVPEDLPLTEVKPIFHDNSKVVEPPELSGLWRSERPEPAGNGRYAVRELKFIGARWSLTYTLAADKAMKNVLFTHKASGEVTNQSPSKRIPGAYLMTYRFNHKTLNIMATDKTTLKELGFDSCPISIRQDVDVTSQGCGIIARLSECPNDYELLRQETRKEGSFISIGNKFAEFSSCSEDKRPVALGVSLIKVK